MVDELFHDVDLDADVRRRRHHRHGAADPARLRPRRSLPRPRRAVVLGGTWVTLTAEASLRHADAVVAGEAEEVWPQVLADFAAGRSRGIYRAAAGTASQTCRGSTTPTLPLLKYDAFKSSWLYRMYFHWPVVFSRGCPHPCEYCAVQTYYQRSFRTRPVDEVIDDLQTIKALGANRILFLDDNPIGHPEAAKELFRAMIPLRAQVGEPVHDQHRARSRSCSTWRRAAAASASRSASRASTRTASTRSARASTNRSRFDRDLAAIRAKGIQVIGLLMVGLDGDTVDTFRRSLQFLIDNKISFLKLFTPCPYPGTKYYDDMAAGRPHPGARLGPLRLRQPAHPPGADDRPTR